MAYPFSVHLKYRGGDDEHVLVYADDSQSAVLAVLNYFRGHDGEKSTRRWVESIEAHWLHLQIPRLVG